MPRVSRSECCVDISHRASNQRLMPLEGGGGVWVCKGEGLLPTVVVVLFLEERLESNFNLELFTSG